MANTNVAFGLRPIGVVGQGYNTTGATEYRIAAGNTNPIYQGFPLSRFQLALLTLLARLLGAL